MHLWCNFNVSRPLFDDSQLDGLQSAISKFLPQWSANLRVARDEDSTTWKVIGPTDRLFDSIHAVAPPKRRLGKATLIGFYGGLSFFLNHCKTTLPPLNNEISIEIYQRSTVEDRAISVWARDMFEAIAERLPLRYANARMSEEYSAKNMIEDERNAKAIGADLIDAIPGLYWLNYFGRQHLELIGRERLLTAPAIDTKPILDGVLLALGASAEAWQSAAYQDREQKCIAHLGEQFFFSRRDPDRKTIAPEFRADEDASNH